MISVSNSPPRPPPVKYHAQHGTRWQREKAAAVKGTFEYPDDPQLIGPWIIGECVGKGASGRVKIAKHCRTGRLAAVKILPLQPLVNSRTSLATQQAKSEKQRLGVDREITMMKLMNHPNIIRIYDVYEGDNELYLILEYVEGGELFDFLVNRGKLQSLEALAVFKQIVYGLNYAHTFSIIHRDLKPENILIHSLNPPLIKIADWGMAAFAPPTLQLETFCGSPHYASPEIVNGEKYEGNATDVWSCGVILYALLTGRLPFDDKNVLVLLSKVKAGKYEMPSHIDSRAKDLLARMLVVDVSQRMTIPEILAHAWLQNVTPGIIYVPAPPVSELARPLRSAAHIDHDLFESLRVIWGRHADPDMVKAELLSPAGEGTLAKVFYFLLHQHREMTLEGRGLIMDIDDSYASPKEGGEKRKVIIKQYVAPQSPLSYSNQFTISTRTHGPIRSNCNASVPPPHRGPSPVQISSLAPPLTKTNSRPRAPPPSGPRPPKPRPLSTPIPRSPQTSTSHQLANSGPGLRPGKDSVQPPRTPSPAYITSPYPDGKPEFESAGTRANTRLSTNMQHPCTPESSISQSPVKPHTQLSPLPAISKRRNTVSPNTQSMHTRTPKPVPLVAPFEPIPMLTAPKMNNPVVQRTIDDITERVNVLVAKGNDSQYLHQSRNNPDNTPVQTQDQYQNSSRLPRLIGSHLSSAVHVPPQQLNDLRRDRVLNGGIADKENWVNDADNYVMVKGDILNVGKAYFPQNVAQQPSENADTTNYRMRNESRSRERKDKNIRPIPLNIQTTALSTKRSALSNLTSPTLTSPPALLSPVGEFKGWFSNLFNWKTQSYVLYSFENITTTRNEVTRLLEQFGVNVSSEDMDGVPVLKCRIEEGTDAMTGLGVQKRMTFRVEFLVAPSSTPGAGRPYGGPASYDGFGQNVSSARTSVMQGKNTTKIPSYYECAIILIQEKGSMSTFRGLSRKMKEEWRLGTGLQSPAIVGRTTPLVEQGQRFTA